jgi:hypothetical protein
VSVAAITDLDPIGLTLMVAALAALLVGRFVPPFLPGAVPFPVRKLHYRLPSTAAQCEHRLTSTLDRGALVGSLFKRRFLLRLPALGRDPVNSWASGTIRPDDTGCRVTVRIGLHGGFFLAIWFFAFVFLGITFFGRQVPAGAGIAPLERSIPAVALSLAAAAAVQWLVSKFVGVGDASRLEQVLARELQAD